ncbi:hypothetical protein [Flavivirga eckloniae]|uniref:Beta-lactamase-inhibitor-like PepSY-like domain-containing protein n=1 Tax=Flavivirga eckloniae TaxID=1803846 RepID=A0A2K9PW43_9FLAO|nr:hypothetical protein [Flavivirga eckloniae]AUP81292.1 hypothetical protein C1H87_22255 [Flavivirga eckloniae]
MKKLILSVAILTCGMSTFALCNNIEPNAVITIAKNEAFKEISLDKLPEAVTKAVKKDFAKATISKAYVNSSEQYKLLLTIDKSESTFYIDKDGNWLEKDSIKS